jgi:hypothetical protein
MSTRSSEQVLDGAANGDHLPNPVWHPQGQPSGEQATHAEPHKAHPPMPIRQVDEAIRATVEQTICGANAGSKVPS